MKALFLAASENRWLREHGVRAPFVRRAVSRFMPGETFEDMLGAARLLPAQGVRSVFTRLGENVADAREAQAVADHYVEGIGRIRREGLDCEPSVKPTQLGLDIDAGRALSHLQTIARASTDAGNYLWVDMEQSSYVDRTLKLVEALRAEHAGVGVCLQAYLHRTPEDLKRMLAAGVGVRLVKGAYREPAAMAVQTKRDVDGSYLTLGRAMLDDRAHGGRARIVFGTHDTQIIQELVRHARSTRVAPGDYEVHMLFGIQRGEQQRLAAAKEHVRVLIAYGAYWFPWYMRRLAERPANVWFVLKSVFR